MSRLLLLSLLLSFCVPAAGTWAGGASYPESDVCQPPISLCQRPLLLDSTSSEVPLPEPVCPPGYACACVPSCPRCDDCAAEVCVPARTSECKTACDCAPGLGCFEGRCIAGFAPVYCCDAEVCPADGQCQHRDGRMDRCVPFDETLCERRVRRVARHIRRWVGLMNHCRDASQCVRVDTSTSCRGTCGAWVNERHARRLQRRIGRLDHYVCSSFREDGCPFATPGCLAETGACVEGRCAGVPIDALFHAPEAGQ